MLKCVLLCRHLFCYLQLLHPLESRVYRESAVAMRKIGHDCIHKRIKAVTSGEEVPKDILTQILQMGGGCG